MLVHLELGDILLRLGKPLLSLMVLPLSSPMLRPSLSLPTPLFWSVLLQSLLPSPLVVDQLNLDMELEGMLSCKAMALEQVLLTGSIKTGATESIAGSEAYGSTQSLGSTPAATTGSDAEGCDVFKFYVYERWVAWQLVKLPVDSSLWFNKQIDIA